MNLTPAIIRTRRTTRAAPAHTARWRMIPVALALCLGVAACGGSRATTKVPVLPPDDVRRTAASVSPLTAINSEADDFGAAMPLDSSIIYFTSRRDGPEQSIYFSRNGAGGWSSPKRAVEIDNGRSNGSASLTPGGETMYFAGDEYGFGDCDMYRVDAGPRGAVPEGTMPWSVPENLGMAINSQHWESQPCLSADGSALYFASDRPGGLGGRDIWVCRRNHLGGWDAPINLGEPINTMFDEMTPWIAPDGATIVFASNGHAGIGGFDLFAATTSAGRTRVEHLGTPINSEADDICFGTSARGDRAFIASNRSEGAGGFDIYEVRNAPLKVDPLAIVRGMVRGADGEPIDATIEVADLAADRVLGRFRTDPDGAYALVLPRGFNYGITANATGHLFQSRQLLAPRDLERTREHHIDFRLALTTGSVRLLVFFETGKSGLLRESLTELDRVVRMMALNPTMHIEVAGHTDNVGDTAVAIPLSNARAQAVKSYLVANRVDAARITTTGYGAARPIGDNGTDEGRALNRRVEMRIVAE